ncbi:MAG: GNAT family N-acetyltransferase [Lachnospiraceae bacterium]|nr:GNAT family N-acetyltransferase [Lachnospiraceae bacterium]
MTEKEYEITDQLSAEEYMEMRLGAGWKEFPIEQAQIGLQNTSILCCIRKDGRPIAFGRVVSDHGYVAYIADVIVRPEYQGQGLGRTIMNRLISEIRAGLKPGYKVMITLMAATGKEAFYEKFGFTKRPDETHGCGMHQWIEATC